MLDYWLFKKIYELALKCDHEEVRNLLGVLQEKYIALCDENSMYKIQLQELEDIIYLANSLINDEELYWLKTGSVRQGPFCKNCYDTKGVLLRMYDRDSEWRCYACGSAHQQKSLYSGGSEREDSAQNFTTGQSRKVIPLYK